MVEISNDFAEAIVESIQDRFDPDILWAVTGENYRNDRKNKFNIKLRMSCPECSNRWTSLHGVLIIYHHVNLRS